MTQLLPQRMHRRLLLLAVASSAVGSLLFALIGGALLLDLGLNEARSQAELTEADLVTELTSYQPLYELQRQVQMVASGGRVRAALVVDQNGMVIAATDRSWVGESVAQLQAKAGSSVVLRTLRGCFYALGTQRCGSNAVHSKFLGWIPVLGGEHLVRFRSTPLALRGLANRSVRATLVTQFDLQPLVQRAVVLARSLFVLGIVPLTLTTVTLVVVLKRRMLPELLLMAQTDAVSGIRNRRSFLEAAKVMLEERRRRGGDVVVVLLDIDHFKAINDRYGHHAGDAVIVQFAEFLSHSVRAGDIVGRFGGDEFALLITSSVDTGHLILKRLVQEAAQTTWRLDDGTSLKLTVSVGMAALNESTITLEDLLRNADAALYMAKDNGRAQMVDFASPPAGWTYRAT